MLQLKTERGLLVKLDTRSAQFMEHKDILQKTVGKKKKTNEDSVCVLESPYLEKKR